MIKQPTNPHEPWCPYCMRAAVDIPDTVMAAKENEYDSVEDFVLAEEGTYNPLNGHFACDSCYIKIGMPVAPSGWKCP